MNRELQGQLYNPNKWARDRSWSPGRPRLEAGKATQITVRPQITTLRTEVREQHTQEITDLLTCLLNMIERKRNQNNSMYSGLDGYRVELPRATRPCKL